MVNAIKKQVVHLLYEKICMWWKETETIEDTKTKMNFRKKQRKHQFGLICSEGTQLIYRREKCDAPIVDSRKNKGQSLWQVTQVMPPLPQNLGIFHTCEASKKTLFKLNFLVHQLYLLFLMSTVVFFCCLYPPSPELNLIYKIEKHLQQELEN